MECEPQRDKKHQLIENRVNHLAEQVMKLEQFVVEATTPPGKEPVVPDGTTISSGLPPLSAFLEGLPGRLDILAERLAKAEGALRENLF